MEPDAAYIPGRQRLKITDVQYVYRSVLADIDDCIFGVGMKYDMTQCQLGRLVAGGRNAVYDVLRGRVLRQAPGAPEGGILEVCLNSVGTGRVARTPS